MLQDIAQVMHFESIEGKPIAIMLRHIKADGQVYSLALNDWGRRDSDSNTHGISFRDSEGIIREISLQRKDGNYGRENWSYGLCVDGIVRRQDGGAPIAEERKEQGLRIEGSEMLHCDEIIKKMDKVILAMQNLVSDAIPNMRLEEDMGINNQPVTPDEIRGLQDFLVRAVDIPR